MAEACEAHVARGTRRARHTACEAHGVRGTRRARHTACEANGVRGTRRARHTACEVHGVRGKRRRARGVTRHSSNLISHLRETEIGICALVFVWISNQHLLFSLFLSSGNTRFNKLSHTIATCTRQPPYGRDVQDARCRTRGAHQPLLNPRQSSTRWPSPGIANPPAGGESSRQVRGLRLSEVHMCLYTPHGRSVRGIRLPGKGNSNSRGARPVYSFR
jgi:hypothetical protein